MAGLATRSEIRFVSPELFTPDGVSWTDSADNPNQVMSWSAQFTVYDSYPKLSQNLETLIRFFKTAGFGRI